MESEGGGIAAAITPRRLSSQHSTLRESFLASDLAEHGLNNTSIVNSNNNNNDNDNNSSYRRPISTLTLGAVLNCDKKSPPQSNIVVRTLLEIIRNDETLNSGSSPRSHFAGKKSWKSFKERLKLKRASLSHSSNSNQNQNQNPNSPSWTRSMPVSQSDVLPISRPSSTTVAWMNETRNSLANSLRNNSLRQVDVVPSDDQALREVDSGGSPRSGGSFRLSAVLAAEREETRRRLSTELIEVNGLEEEEVVPPRVNNNSDAEEDGEVEEQPNLDSQENQPVRMSLMDLLEETDRQAGVSGPLYSLDDDDVDEEEEEEAKVEEELEESCDGKGEHSCCVCMVRHKGAAFIPCGHTFCRLCSRELWVQRGNCPLCNNFILEVLDIF